MFNWVESMPTYKEVNREEQQIMILNKLRAIAQKSAQVLLDLYSIFLFPLSSVYFLWFGITSPLYALPLFTTTSEESIDLSGLGLLVIPCASLFVTALSIGWAYSIRIHRRTGSAHEKLIAQLSAVTGIVGFSMCSIGLSALALENANTALWWVVCAGTFWVVSGVAPYSLMIILRATKLAF